MHCKYEIEYKGTTFGGDTLGELIEQLESEAIEYVTIVELLKENF